MLERINSYAVVTEIDKTFVLDCAKMGISLDLAKDTLAILSHSLFKLAKYDIADTIHSYFILSEDSVKLICSVDDILQIVDFAMEEVVREMEFDLKENFKIDIDDIEEGNMLEDCGVILDRMFSEYQKVEGCELSLSKKVYYHNLSKIASKLSE